MGNPFEMPNYGDKAANDDEYNPIEQQTEKETMNLENNNENLENKVESAVEIVPTIDDVGSIIEYSAGQKLESEHVDDSKGLASLYAEDSNGTYVYGRDGNKGGKVKCIGTSIHVASKNSSGVYDGGREIASMNNDSSWNIK